VVILVPPDVAVIVTWVGVATDVVVKLNVAELPPPATTTSPGTVTTGLLLWSNTTSPPAGARASSVTVPCADVPPKIEDGLAKSAVTGTVFTSVPTA